MYRYPKYRRPTMWLGVVICWASLFGASYTSKVRRDFLAKESAHTNSRSLPLSYVKECCMQLVEVRPSFLHRIMPQSCFFSYALQSLHFVHVRMVYCPPWLSQRSHQRRDRNGWPNTSSGTTYVHRQIWHLKDFAHSRRHLRGLTTSSLTILTWTTAT